MADRSAISGRPSLLCTDDQERETSVDADKLPHMPDSVFSGQVAGSILANVLTPWASLPSISGLRHVPAFVGPRSLCGFRRIARAGNLHLFTAGAGPRSTVISLWVSVPGLVGDHHGFSRFNGIVKL